MFMKKKVLCNFNYKYIFQTQKTIHLYCFYYKITFHNNMHEHITIITIISLYCIKKNGKIFKY